MHLVENNTRGKLYKHQVVDSLNWTETKHIQNLDTVIAMPLDKNITIRRLRMSHVEFYTVHVVLYHVPRNQNYY